MMMNGGFSQKGFLVEAFFGRKSECLIAFDRCLCEAFEEQKDDSGQIGSRPHTSFGPPKGS